MKNKAKIIDKTHVWVDENNDGTSHYKDGKKHREDGPAVELKNGTNEWWIEGKLHREDGPAIFIPINQPWWKNELHQDSFEIYWFLNGTELTEEEFNHRLIKKELNEKLNSTLSQKSIIKRSKI